MTPEPLTQPQPPSLAQVPPFAAMLRATVLPMVACTPVIVGVCWVAGNARAGLSGLLGVVIAALFFVSGLFVISRVAKANPLSVLAGALAVYLGQVLFLGVVILSLSGAGWLDGTSFGLSVLAVALIWQLCQVVAFVRLRKPVYDPAAEQSVPSAPEPSRAQP